MLFTSTIRLLRLTHMCNAYTTLFLLRRQYASDAMRWFLFIYFLLFLLSLSGLPTFLAFVVQTVHDIHAERKRDIHIKSYGERRTTYDMRTNSAAMYASSRECCCCCASSCAMCVRMRFMSVHTSVAIYFSKNSCTKNHLQFQCETQS